MKVGVIGAGPHFFSRYAPVLRECSGINIDFIVDLEAKREWVTMQVHKGFREEVRLIFVPNSMRLEPKEEEIEAHLGKLVRQGVEERVFMVCAEPCCEAKLSGLASRSWGHESSLTSLFLHRWESKGAAIY